MLRPETRPFDYCLNRHRFRKIVGGVTSPLLANLYMRRFVLGWKTHGHEQRLDAHIVNYADDFVICCRGTAAKADAVMRVLMARLRLTVNETKTRVCRLPDETFAFLGYTFGRNYSPRTGRSYLGPRPSGKKIHGICQEIREQTSRKWLWLAPEEVVNRLNRQLVGWANYFCLGTTAPALQQVMAHTCQRLRQWLGRKHRVQGPARARYSDRYLRAELGLVWLPERPRPRLLWAKA